MKPIKHPRTLILVAIGILLLGSVAVATFLREQRHSLDLVREGDRLKKLELTCWDEYDARIKSTVTVHDRDQLDMIAYWLASREDSWEALGEGALALRRNIDGVFVWESGREMGFFTSFRWIFLEGHSRHMDEFDYRFLRSYCGEFYSESKLGRTALRSWRSRLRY